MHEQDVAMVKGLISVAWADGRVSAEEHEVIDALVDAFGASPSEAHELRKFAANPRTLDDVPLTDLSYDDRRVLLHHAVVVTHADGHAHEGERQLLEALCKRLRIPDLEARGIVEAAERAVAARVSPAE